MMRPRSVLFSAVRQASACLLLAATAQATITATGSVSPNPPMTGDFVSVGAGPPGMLDINGGDSLSLTGLQIGTQGVGIVSVADPGSRLTIDNSVFVGGIYGRLDVLGGATLNVAGNLDLSIAGGPSDMRVDGERTVVSLGGELSVGVEGTSKLDVTGGSILTTNQFWLGSLGEVHVGGNDTRFLMPSFSSIRNPVRGTLRVSDGAQVDLRDIEFAESGRLLLNGGTANLGRLTNNGLIAGDGRINLPGDEFFSSGRIETGAGENLTIEVGQFGFQSQLFNTGEVLSDGGAIELIGRLTNDLGGRVTLRDGRLRVNSSEGVLAIDNRDLIAAAGGVNDIHGRIVNNGEGSIAVTNSSVLVLHDQVTVEGSGAISVMPGSRAVFLDDLNINSFGTFQANIAGTDDNTGFGVAEVVGEANIAGAVDVSLLAGFEPTLGDRFSLLTASGGVTGAPTVGDAPDPGELLKWDVRTNGSLLELVVAPELDGDFNLDGLVNTADYAVWRDGLGVAYDQSDYDRWRGNVGATASSPLQAIPEPSAFLLLGLACGGFASAPRRRV